MASTSKSKSKSIRAARPRNQKVKQIWQVKQPKRNWLDLPADITANILLRLGAIDIIENAQKVCMAWRYISKDPAMWRVIDMENLDDLGMCDYYEKMCKHVVDRSQGQLVDINIEYFGSMDLLHYIADRSSQLRRLQLAGSYGTFCEGFSEVLPKFPLLEELTLCLTDISKEDIEVAGRCCPLLKTLKINNRGCRIQSLDTNEYMQEYNAEAVAIGKNLPELRHLQLIGNSMSNIGLQAILDGCTHLESLDLRQCPNIRLDGELGKRCSEQIKCLRLPGDSLEDYKFDAEIYDFGLSDNNPSGIFSDYYDEYSDYDECSDYDDFINYDDDTDFEDFGVLESLKAMFEKF